MDKIKRNNLKTAKILDKRSLFPNNNREGTGKETMAAWKIYLLIPNLIGYIRILLVVLGFYICFKNPYWFLVCYSLSQFLDALDGYAARYFRQSTRYGAMLDMVTDRGSTAALLIALAKLYPAYTRLFMAVIVLDIISHFAYIYSSLIYGKTSHKLVSKTQNQLLRIYYSYKSVLFLLCLGNEGYLLFLYLRHFEPTLGLPSHLQSFVIPFLHYLLACLFSFKQLINVVQLIQAAHDTVKFDMEDWINKHPSPKPSS
jgi:CDP-diacylglycerol--inositol 3-phosphatidyltransferase